MGVAGEAGDPPAVAALVLGPAPPATSQWWDGDFLRKSYGAWCWWAGIAPPPAPPPPPPLPPLVPAAKREEPGAAAVEAGMFWLGIGQDGSHGSARKKIYFLQTSRSLKVLIDAKVIVADLYVHIVVWGHNLLLPNHFECYRE